MEQSLAQMYKDNLKIVVQTLEQYKKEMVVFQRKYDMLRDDYNYNLRVVQERDEELRRCDSKLSEFCAVRI